MTRLTVAQQRSILEEESTTTLVSVGPEDDERARLICALLASAATFVPVPFVDDLLRERVAQYMVSRTLRREGRTFGSARVKPLWAPSGGCVQGCLLFLLKLPVALLLFPIRKLVAWLSLAKTFAEDLTTMILLGHALDRSLERGRLAAPEGVAGYRALEEEAARIRVAFDAARKGFDAQILTAYLKRALSGVKGLGGAAVRAVRALFRRSPPEGDLTLPTQEREVLEAGAREVSLVLDDPKVREMLERFELRFEEELRAVET
ncbi:MAG: hypothetical protein AAGF12_39780 [Myxococcota bacterium]